MPATPNSIRLRAMAAINRSRCPRQQHVLSENFVANGASAVHRQRDMTRMLHLRHFIRVTHDPVDLIAEPYVHGLVHQAAGHEGQEHGGDQ